MSILHVSVNIHSAFPYPRPGCMSISMFMPLVCVQATRQSMLHVHTCPYPCCKFMFLLHVHAHVRAACLCQRYMSMSMLHVHVQVHVARPCPCCTSMFLSMFMLHIYMYVYIRIQWFWPVFENCIVSDLKKAFFYIFSGFFLNWAFVSKKLKNGLCERWKFFFEIVHIGYEKSRISCWFQNFHLP
jgi:hypothetical protein